MALLKYLKKSDSVPNPEGPLSSRVPASTIAASNKEVRSLLAKNKSERKHGRYSVYTEQEKAKIAKRAAEMGVTSTIRHFKTEFIDRLLKESTVCTWQDQYVKELDLRLKLGKDIKIESQKRGHPTLLGKEMDKELQEYNIKSLRESNAIINVPIVMAAAEGIVKDHHSNLLVCNGGHINGKKLLSSVRVFQKTC